MKTVLEIGNQLADFFGSALTEEMLKPTGFMDRARGVRLLRKAMESDYSNLETRVAFVSIVGHAPDKDERAALISAMKISMGTFYSWKKDHKAYLEGTIKTRTVVIRK